MVGHNMRRPFEKNSTQLNILSNLFHIKLTELNMKQDWWRWLIYNIIMYVLSWRHAINYNTRVITFSMHISSHLRVACPDAFNHLWVVIRIDVRSSGVSKSYRYFVFNNINRSLQCRLVCKHDIGEGSTFTSIKSPISDLINICSYKLSFDSSREMSNTINFELTTFAN